MKTFRIFYRDNADAPTFALLIRAYDREHAIEKFYDSDDNDWQLVSVQAVSNA